MDTKIVWQCDGDGNLLGEIKLSEANGDVGKSGWLIPAGCIEEEPMEQKEGYFLRWKGEQWVYEEFSTPTKDEVEKSEIDLQEMLNSEFGGQKQELLEAFLTAQIREDGELQVEIREELAELETDYAQKKEMIEQGCNPWESEAESC